MRHISTAVLAAMASLALFSPSSHAVEREVASYVLDTDVTVFNDLRTRGLSDSLMRPAVKLGLQLAHESGMVAIVEVVNVSKKQFLKGRGIDVTLGGGYRFGDPEAWHFGVGLAAELFPGAKFEAPHGFDMTEFTPTDVRSTSYSSRFALFEFGYGNIEGRLLDVISKTYRGADTGGVCGSLLQFSADPTPAFECYARGDHNSRGSLLFDLTYKTDIAPATTLTLHAGRQRVANFSEANFNDYRIGLTRKQWGFEWNADWVMTRNKVRELYLTIDGSKVRPIDKDKLMLSVTRRF
ncbi:TorF family putative porin [Massilia sp. YIM B04103]|uniref:TorF family putative porin n=1 Tax=Massilia sp. YIM B04103 TaxID=2963106 RepID=UPI00210CDB6B|nr:TorF family putative porin [Massilia sp. YIM B04103]